MRLRMRMVSCQIIRQGEYPIISQKAKKASPAAPKNNMLYLASWRIQKHLAYQGGQTGLSAQALLFYLSWSHLFLHPSITNYLNTTK